MAKKVVSQTDSKTSQSKTVKPVLAKPLYLNSGTKLPEEYICVSNANSCAITDCGKDSDNRSLLSGLHGIAEVHGLLDTTSIRARGYEALKVIKSQIKEAKMTGEVFISYRFNDAGLVWGDSNLTLASLQANSDLQEYVIKANAKRVKLNPVCLNAEAKTGKTRKTTIKGENAKLTLKTGKPKQVNQTGDTKQTDTSDPLAQPA